MKRILFLADRNILVDQTIQQDFAPFGEAMHKITNREAKRNYEIYLALYQAVTGVEESKQIFRQLRPRKTKLTNMGKKLSNVNTTPRISIVT